MKKFKNKILIPIITSLSTVALVAPLATSVTIKAINNNGSLKSVNDAANATSYVTITYVGETDSTTGWSSTIQGPNRVRVKSGNSFGSAQKPTAVHSAGLNFKGWSKDPYTVTNRTVITDDQKITSNITLYPVFSASTLIINGPDEIVSDQEITYTASIPGVTTTKLSWKATIKGDGNVSMYDTGLIDVSAGANGTITITATDAISGLSATKEVKVVLPWFNSDKVWTIDNTSHPFWVNMDDICDETAAIRLYAVGNDGTTPTKTIERASFNHAIYIGENVTYLPDNFGINLTALSSNRVWFETTGTNEGSFSSTSKCTMIGKCFLQNCASWNMILNLPASLRSIDDGFLYGCSSFANRDQAFALPNNLVNIGSYFMYGCKAFNEDLTIHKTVAHVGEHFMANCDKFTSTLTINTPVENFDVFGDISYTLATDNENAECYTTGVKIAGAYNQEFKAKFPDRTKSTEVTAAYRKLTAVSSEYTTCSWEEVAILCEKLEDNPTDEGKTAFYSHFLVSGTQATSMDSFVSINALREITLNGYTHKVTTVDYLHDTIAEGQHATQKAALTFDLYCLLSDNSGYNFITLNWGENGNTSFTTDSLLTQLNNETDKELSWYKHSSSSTSSYTATSPYYQLSQQFGKDVIKKVTKSVALGTSFDVTNYNTYLFPLTYTEMAGASTTGVKTEGTAYSFWSKGASRSKYNAAGSGRNNYWLASPYTLNQTNAWLINQGNFANDACKVESPNSPATGISFAFCI